MAATKTKPQSKPTKADNGNGQKGATDLAPRPEVAMAKSGFAPRNFEEAWRFAEALCRSQLVPRAYQGNAHDCFIALDISARLGVHYLAVMSHVFRVHGAIGLDAQVALTTINQSGLFTDPIDYEIVGGGPTKADYRVRAYATRRGTGKVVYGPWIDWQLVKAEGWDARTDEKGKPCSKWLTMPEQMFRYRAASWFKNSICPEVTLGMPTTDELEDMPVGRKHVEIRELTPTNGTRQPFGFTGEQQETEQAPQEPEKENQAEPTAESEPEGPTGPDWPTEDAEQTEQDAPKPLQYRCGNCKATFMQPRDGKCPACLSKKIEAA